MGEGFAGSAGICWAQALQVLAVSVGFVRGWGGWMGAWQSMCPVGIAVLGVRAPEAK